MKFSRILTLLGIILFSSLAVFSILYALDPANFRKKEIKNKISVNLNQNSGIIYHSANNSILNTADNKKTNEGEKNLQWIKLTDSAPWEPRDSGVAFVFQNKIWLAGGLNGNKRVSENHTIKYWLAPHFNDIWSTEDGINWKLVTETPPWKERQGHSLISYQNHLWIIGRLNDSEYGGVNDVWFSKDGIHWEKTKNDPEWSGREDFFSVVFKNKIWVFGGMDANWKWKNDVWVSELSNE